MAKPQFTYAKSGVDVDIEEMAAKLLYEAAKNTWETRRGRVGEIVVPFDDFSGIRAINVSQLPTGTFLNIGFDGIGTKAELAVAASRYDTIGFDLMAMVCDDAVVRGAEPIVVGSILDINTLGQDKTRLPIIKQLAKGYEAAAKQAEVAIINGELAQLGSWMGDSDNFHFSWGSALLWLGNKKRMFTGREIKRGDYLVGFQETGFRSNGFSLVRTILKARYGEMWKSEKLGRSRVIDLALKPSRIYSRAVVDMFGGYDLKRKPKADIHGVVHVTGSGLPGKLGRVLKPSGLGADVTDPFPPPPIMRHCQEIGSVTDREAYRTWNMGQGMVIITPDPKKVIKIAATYGITSKEIGRIRKRPGITIASQGVEGGMLEFSASGQ